MLINAYARPPRPVAGCRLLEENFNILGRELQDPHERGRIWTLENAYSPASGRRIGGIRVKARDQKGFITFINQRDLEVLLGEGFPNAWCEWSGSRYVGPQHADWVGFAADDDDLLDDLYEVELALREESLILPAGLTVTRLVHLARGTDRQEQWAFVMDVNLRTGLSPDTGFSTLKSRWTLLRRDTVYWERMP